MPLTRVSIRRGKPESYRKAILKNVYESMHETFNVPQDDYFMVLTEHDACDFTFPAKLDDVVRSEDLVLIQITCNNTRNLDQKKALYKRIAERLEKDPGISSNDVLVNLLEVPKENWSMSHGLATFA